MDNSLAIQCLEKNALWKCYLASYTPIEYAIAFFILFLVVIIFWFSKVKVRLLGLIEVQLSNATEKYNNKLKNSNLNKTKMRKKKIKHSERQ